MDEFWPRFAEGFEAKEKERACLIERACVMAKRGLWAHAIDDLAAAAQIGDISAAEYGLAENVVTKAQPWESLKNDDAAQKRLAGLYRAGGAAGALVFAISRPLVWQMKLGVKTGHISRAMRYGELLFKILGPVGGSKRLGYSLMNIDARKAAGYG